MDTNTTKGVAIVILFLLTVFFGCLPVWLHYRGSLSSTGSPRRKLVLDILNCFAGGVFLGTCLVHLLAEGMEQFQEYLDEVHFTSDFPFYDTLVGVGVFMIAVVEKSGFALLSLSKEKEGAGDGRDGTEEENKRQDAAGSSRKAGYGTVSQTPSRPQDFSKNSPLETSFSLDGTQVKQMQAETGTGFQSSSRTEDPLTQAADTAFYSNGSQNQSQEVVRFESGIPDGSAARSFDSSGAASKGSKWVQGSQNDGSILVSVTSDNDRQRLLPQRSRHDHQQQHHHDLEDAESGHIPDISKMAAMRAFLLLIALSFHTVFDGLAVGLQDTQYHVWEVLLAIALHKSLASFCLGLQLAAATPNNARRPVLFMTLFSFITPLGIAIGMIVTSNNVNEPTQLLVSSVLQALATGTFLYVTFFEILGHQFASHHRHDSDSNGFSIDILKVTCAAVGFICMASVKVLDKD